MTMLDAWRCNECGHQWDRWRSEPEYCQKCLSPNTGKDWGSYNFGFAFDDARGPNNEIRVHGALDDPLTKIELGFGRPGDTLRTTNDDQVKDLREKAIAGEDSGKLRQQVLDIRSKNVSNKGKKYVKD